MREKAIYDVGEMPPLGHVPKAMHAIVIRKDREGEPQTAMQHEQMPVPAIGPNEVLVYVMGAGVNFNGVWAARGKPVSIMKSTGDDFHIAGSDASGIVWKVGSNVKRWKVGDEVVVHCNQSCGQCPECNGLDPMACAEQKIWGYETNWGSFAQFTKVQAQQLLPKPRHLSWMDAASYGLTYFTAYRMLVDQAEMKAGDNVLVWGASGGLGIFAVQLCKVMGANAIAVVSSPAKAELAKSLGAKWTINRKDYDFARRENETPEQTKHRLAETRRLGKAIREMTGGKDVDIVFEHVGRETFPTSVLLAKRFGKIVICGATSGYHLDFDVRHLWMRQKQILGSHFANAYEATRANQLIIEGKVVPYLDATYAFDDTPRAHQDMAENKHMGKMAIAVGAAAELHAEEPEEAAGYEESMQENVPAF
ncbi:crotonyl-CoA carboxylase/reductase [Vulgatibacter sp.]|uniref:crotonyl-CoA carboxylase/reductase n=1 Tax=Vulgatibacter sp. TaxID=1971226 RepID=UPI003561AA9B